MDYVFYLMLAGLWSLSLYITEHITYQKAKRNINHMIYVKDNDTKELIWDLQLSRDVDWVVLNVDKDIFKNCTVEVPYDINDRRR